MASGLLVALPLESVAVRLTIALGVALLLLRIVSRWDLRSPRARTVLASSPFIVATAVLLLSSGELGLPSVLVPATAGTGTLALPLADRYLDFAPIGPVIVTVWAAVSTMLLGVRAARAAAARRRLLAGARPVEPRVAALVLRLARAHGITPPRALVARGPLVGAAVVGVRRPLLLLDARLLVELDADELEGVVAHELAHIARRDTVLAWAVAAVRDLAFFVPGAGWAVRALHREREAAADLDAVAVTGRPAALASGLLHGVELARGAGPVPHGCAALVERGGVVDRVHLLLREEQPTARDHRVELGLVAAIGLVAVAAAVVLPTFVTGGVDGPRDAVGVLVEPGGAATATTASSDPGARGRVFTVFERFATGPATESGATFRVRPVDLVGPQDRPGAAQACAVGAATCTVEDGTVGLSLRPAPIVLLDRDVPARWQATPLTEGPVSERLSVYWLSRLEGPTPAGGVEGAASPALP